MAKNNLTKALKKMVKNEAALREAELVQQTKHKFSSKAEEHYSAVLRGQKNPQQSLQESLMEKALNDLCGNYHTKGSLWETSLTGELRGLVIGGYGNPNEGCYGAGPTRSVNHATYFVRVVGTVEGVPLVQSTYHGLSSEPTAQLDSLVGRVEAILSEDEAAKLAESLGKKEDKHSYRRDEQPFKTVVAKCGVKVDDIPTYVQIAIGNVRKEGSTVVGDVGIYLTRQLGSGLNFVSREEYHKNATDSTRTLDILEEKTPYAPTFRFAVTKAVRDLGSACNEFMRKFDYDGNSVKRWQCQPMLTIDNV